jgi:DNA-directed RNA polymerase specialized sigma24 family protein
MSKLYNGGAGVAQPDYWLGAPIAALLEAIRRARSGRFRNASLSTRDLLHTLIRRFDNNHPTVDGAPVADLPAFARRFAERRLIDHYRRKQLHHKHAQTARLALSQPEPELEDTQAEAATITAIDWFITTLDRLERGELPSEIVVPTSEGQARLRLRNAVNVARTLRGLYIEGRNGRELAIALEVSEGQVSKYKAAGLRYIQILAAKELP